MPKITENGVSFKTDIDADVPEPAEVEPADQDGPELASPGPKDTGGTQDKGRKSEARTEAHSAPSDRRTAPKKDSPVSSPREKR